MFRQRSSPSGQPGSRLPAEPNPTDHLLHQLTEASWVARSMPASHAAGVLGALTERDRSQQDKSLRHPLLATDRALPRGTTSGPSRRPVVPADDGPQNVIALFGGVLSLRSHVWSALVEDLKAFRRVCHEAASRTGGTVTEFGISTR